MTPIHKNPWPFPPPKQLRKFKSWAVWPKSVNTHTNNNQSSDTHDTREAAEAVCRLLKRYGYGGQGEHLPLATWVEELK